MYYAQLDALLRGKMIGRIPAGIFCLALIGVLFFSGCSRQEVTWSAPVLPAEVPVEVPTNLSPSTPGAAAEEPTASPAFLTLDRAIDEALAASPELEQVKQRIQAASEQVKQAEALFYPRLVFTEDYGLTDQPGSAFMYILNQRRFQSTLNFNDPGVQQNFATRIQGQITVFSGGADWYGRKAAQFQQHAVSAEYNATINQLVSNVSETYFKWLQALGFIGVAERAFESAKVGEEIGAARVRAQAALPSELTRLKVRTAETHSNLISAKTGARRLQAAIERLIVRPVRPEEVPEPAAELERPGREPPASGQKELVDQALKYRPEMAAAASLIQAARERVRASRSGFLPKISANAFYEWDNQNLGDIGISHRIGSGPQLTPEGWFLGVTLSWPLFEGGTSLARMREAEANLEQMKAHGRQVALDIALEVNQASLAVEEAMEKIRVSEVQKKLADESLSETRRLYRDQAATIDALLQAEVASNRADVSYTAALFDGKIAQTALMQSLGAFTDWTKTHK